jgi:hypothetical protein
MANGKYCRKGKFPVSRGKGLKKPRKSTKVPCPKPEIETQTSKTRSRIRLLTTQTQGSERVL